MSYNFTSTLDLNPVRLLNDQDAYSYVNENRPHLDTLSNLNLLVNAINELRTAVNTQLVGPTGTAGTPGATGSTGATGAAGESAPVMGMLIWPSGMALPNTNWVVCNEQELLITDYPLIESLGSTFGTPSEAGKVKLPGNTGNAIPNTVLIMRVKNNPVS